MKLSIVDIVINVIMLFIGAGAREFFAFLTNNINNLRKIKRDDNKACVEFLKSIKYLFEDDNAVIYCVEFSEEREKDFLFKNALHKAETAREILIGKGYNNNIARISCFLTDGQYEQANNEFSIIFKAFD